MWDQIDCSSEDPDELGRGRAAPCNSEGPNQFLKVLFLVADFEVYLRNKRAFHAPKLNEPKPNNVSRGSGEADCGNFWLPVADSP